MKAQGGTVSRVLLCTGMEPQERGEHWEQSHSPPPLQTVGENLAANGLGMIRRRRRRRRQQKSTQTSGGIAKAQELY